MDKKIQLKFFTLMAGHTHGSYNLVLQEKEGVRKIPIIVGTFEAQAIATEIEGIQPQRPLTHDLFTSIFKELDIELKEVMIYDLQTGVFYARLVLQRAGLTYEIDARTSDAIAIALRTKSPIFIDAKLFSEIGVDEKEPDLLGDDDDSPEPATPSGDYSHYNRDQLERMLQEAVDAEDYFKAAMIRDELNKRR